MTLRDPASGLALEFKDGELRSASGEIAVPVVDGVPDFLGGGSASEGRKDFQTDFQLPVQRFGALFEAGSRAEVAAEERAISRLADRFGRRLDVLDVGAGCRKFVGSGPLNLRYCELVGRVARSYVALEPSWEMIHRALQPESRFHRFPDAMMIRGVGEAIPLKDASVDLVVAKATLDHCVDSAAVLREIRRVLRPGGAAVISLQNFDSWHRRLVRTVLPGRYRRHRERDHHASLFNPNSAMVAARVAGLTVESCTEMGYLDLCRYTGVAFENVLAALPRLVGGERAVDGVVRSADRLGTTVCPGAGARFVLVAGERERSPG